MSTLSAKARGPKGSLNSRTMAEMAPLIPPHLLRSGLEHVQEAHRAAAADAPLLVG